jgi:hypothetical protein
MENAAGCVEILQKIINEQESNTMARISMIFMDNLVETKSKVLE